MVKTPRSTGCRACVSRKKKCDGARPRCKNCAERNIACPGYGPRNTFIDVGPALRERHQLEVSASRARTPLSSNGSASRKDNNEERVSSALIIQENDAAGARDETILTRFDDIDDLAAPRSFALLEVISPKANETQLFSQFVNSLNTPPQANWYSGVHSWNGWLKELAGHPPSSQVLESSVRALSLSYIGREHDDRPALLCSKQQYGRALNELNLSLRHPETAASLETLLSAVILSFYEIYCGTDQIGWVRHAGGAARLFQLRGADMHETGLARSTLAAYRSFLITEAMVARKSSFLNSPSWRKMLRKTAEKHKDDPLLNGIEAFYCALTRHSQFYESVCTKGATCTTPELKDLVEWGNKLRATLKDCHRAVDQALRAKGLDPVLVQSMRMDTPFPTIYKYPNSRIGSFYCAFWFAHLSLNNITARLSMRLNNVTTNSAKNHSLDRVDSMISDTVHPSDVCAPPPSLYDPCKIHLESIKYSRNLCMSIEDLSTSIFLGSMNLVIALRGAMPFLETAEEVEWTRARLRSMSKHIGLAESATPHRVNPPEVILEPARV